MLEHLARALEAFGRLPRHRLRDEPVEQHVLRHSRHARDRRRDLLGLHADDGLERAAHEGKAPGERPEDDHADRVEIRGEPDRLGVPELLRRHVSHASDEVIRRREAARVTGDFAEPGHAEVDELHRLVEALVMDEDVRRLDVAVDDLLIVAVADADEQLLDPANGDRAGRPRHAGAWRRASRP